MGEKSLITTLGGLSERLRRRRFELLPLRGPGAMTAQVQGRQPGESTSPEALSDLISSISEIGYLQPVLCEELPADTSHRPHLVVTVGERRLRAGRWGAVHLPDNPHFDAIPAVICPGPLSEEERRVWQLVENLAREPLRPGEQAAALLWQRCAILTGKLLAGGIPVPAEVYDREDPADRFRELEKLRGNRSDCAAPWSEVLHRLGLQLTPRKARELVRAFTALPRDLVDEMDEARVTLHTRIQFADLRRGRADAAGEIWAAVKTRARPDLLPAAINAAAQPGVDADSAVAAAERVHSDANDARAVALRASSPPASSEEGEPGASRSNPPSRGTAEAGTGAVIDPITVTQALHGLRALLAGLATARRLDRHDAASLSLLCQQLQPLLGNTS